MPSLFQPHYTNRDYALLCTLFESRLAARAHLCAIHFAGHARMTKKRLQRLVSDGVVGTRARRPNEPALHFLTKRGYEVLETEGHLSTYPRFGYERFRQRIDVSPLTLAHELAVMDVKAAFHGALLRRFPATDIPDLTITAFSTWPLLSRFRFRSDEDRSAWAYPDAAFSFRGNQAAATEQHFYVEVDRSTETLSVLLSKAMAYLQHGHHDRQQPFRVLWVFRTAQRRDHAAATFAMSRPPVLTQAWMTTMDELRADPYGRIWIRPADVRDDGGDSPPKRALWDRSTHHV